MQHIKEENDLDVDPQNILYMGGLRKKLPFTFIAAVIASLALIGLPLTSGYLSKDGILIQAFEWSDGKEWYYRLIPVFAMLSSLLTAFYIARLIVKVFFGEFRLQKINPHIHIHCNDGNWQFKLPLLFLTICCLFPLFSFNPLVYEHAWIFNGFTQAGSFERLNIYHTIIPAFALLVNILVIYAAYSIYVKRNTFTFNQTGFFFRLSYHEWYIDRFYHLVIVRSILALSSAASWFDKNIIDGFINVLKYIVLTLSKITAWIDGYIIDGFLHLLTAIVQQIGNFARNFQSGKIQYYLFSMLAVILALFILFLIKI
jgi:NADH-quinone oxidoreductase subunit L